jgi:hypothetical protein
MIKKGQRGKKSAVHLGCETCGDRASSHEISPASRWLFKRRVACGCSACSMKERRMQCKPHHLLHQQTRLSDRISIFTYTNLDIRYHLLQREMPEF